MHSNNFTFADGSGFQRSAVISQAIRIEVYVLGSDTYERMLDFHWKVLRLEISTKRRVLLVLH
jgi:hypothetical protein